MKKVIFLLFALVFILYINSNAAFLGARGSGGDQDEATGGCNLGNQNTAESNHDIGTGQVRVFRVQVSCSGTVGTAYVYGRGNGGSAANIKVLVYASSASTPQSGDALIVASGVIASDAAQGYISSEISSGSITSGNYYWIGIATEPGGNSYLAYDDDTATLYYKVSDYYTSPPATMGTSWNNIASGADISMYITVE